MADGQSMVTRMPEMQDTWLDDDAVQRIAGSLAGQALQREHLLQLAAAIHQTELRNEDASTGRGTKADLRIAARQAAKAADALEYLPLQAAVLASLGKSGDDSGYNGFLRRRSSVVAELRWMHGLLENWGTERTRAVPNIDIAMTVSVKLLAQFYEASTGKQPTHSYHRDGEYIGRPLSAFGRFAVAFFREVDPDRSETSISTSIRIYLSDRDR